MRKWLFVRVLCEDEREKAFETGVFCSEKCWNDRKRSCFGVSGTVWWSVGEGLMEYLLGPRWASAARRRPIFALWRTENGDFGGSFLSGLRFRTGKTEMTLCKVSGQNCDSSSKGIAVCRQSFPGGWRPPEQQRRHALLALKKLKSYCWLCVLACGIH